MMRDPKLLF